MSIKKEKTFLKFFLYVEGICFIFGLIGVAGIVILQLSHVPFALVLYLGFCVYFGLVFGLFGHFYAQSETLTIRNSKQSIDEISSMLDPKKYKIISSADNELIFSSSKYREWFYGRIYIQSNDNDITIKAAKCIMKKYFSSSRFL